MHTKGKWTVGMNAFGIHVRCRVSYNTSHHFERIATMMTGDKEANANLIAAAPALLEACRFIKDWLESGRIAANPKKYEKMLLDKVETAIAEAENSN